MKLTLVFLMIKYLNDGTNERSNDRLNDGDVLGFTISNILGYNEGN